ncbi:MAG TPA: Mur ligase domain-containing protein, partial [Agriterribacter sp.]|nr:Mur ligase domain-containing protein [Agriterribacter sp.]
MVVHAAYTFTYKVLNKKQLPNYLYVNIDPAEIVSETWQRPSQEISTFATMQVEQLYRIYAQYPSAQTDTRKLKKGDIFFALKGPSFNGNRFAKQALESGAACVV